MTVLFAVAVVLFWSATAWLQRSGREAVGLDLAGPHRFVSDAGPVDVTGGDRPVLRYRGSWLLSGPRLRSTGVGMSAELPPPAGPSAPPTELARRPPPGPSGVELECPGRFPCRAASRLEFPPGSEVEVVATAGDVSIVGFDGRLGVSTTGEAEVFLGPVDGVLDITTEHGGVYGFGLRADDVMVETVSGEIELRFAVAPRRLWIEAGGEPVTIELPDGDYAVSVRGGSSIAVNVGQAASADNEILIQARGPVRIDPSE